jgi:tripartite motif-containing protein 71
MVRKLTYVIFGVAIIGVALLILVVYRTEVPPPTVFYEFAGEWDRDALSGGLFVSAFYDVAVSPSGTIYVTDEFASRVRYFSPTGEFLGQWGSKGKGKGEFIFPKSVAVAPGGNVYVADGAGRAQYFTATGSFLGEWEPVDEIFADSAYLEEEICGFIHASESGLFGGTAEVDIGPNGDVYVADSVSHCVRHFTAAGSYMGKWGTKGTGDGEFNEPVDVRVAPNGSVYVADLVNDRVQYFTEAGSFLGKWGESGATPGQFDRPWAVAVEPDGTVFVSDAFNERVQYFTLNGSYLGHLEPKVPKGTRRDIPIFASSLAVARNGDVYLTFLGRMQRFTEVGKRSFVSRLVRPLAAVVVIGVLVLAVLIVVRKITTRARRKVNSR